MEEVEDEVVAGGKKISVRLPLLLRRRTHDKSHREG